MVEVVRCAIPWAVKERALRRLTVEVVRCGLTPENVKEWRGGTPAFPALRFEPEILELENYFPPGWADGVRCEPQIIMQWPDERPWAPYPHIDEPPPWAEPGQRYKRIVGVALSEWNGLNGTLHIHHGGTDWQPIHLAPGDIVSMDPDTPHSGSPNTVGSVRFGVYFRYLEPVQQVAA